MMPLLLVAMTYILEFVTNLTCASTAKDGGFNIEIPFQIIYRATHRIRGKLDIDYRIQGSEVCTERIKPTDLMRIDD